jgi:hypothetical protein
VVQPGAAVGGSRSLAKLIDDHGEAIEADLHRFYNVDLLDVFRGKLSPRKALVLINALPDTSATVAHMHNGDRWRDFYGWGQDRLISAGTYDAVNSNSVITAKVAGVKRALKIPPYPKPWDKKDGISQGVPLIQIARRQVDAARKKVRSLVHEVDKAVRGEPDEDNQTTG